MNGDGKVDLADLQAFAPTYMSRAGSPNYNPAADFNHNGIINLYDAKALLRNLAPISPRIPLGRRAPSRSRGPGPLFASDDLGGRDLSQDGHDRWPHDTGKPDHRG